MRIHYETLHDSKEIYDFFRQLSFPYRYETDWDTWLESFSRDTDGEGRRLFGDLQTIGAYDRGAMVGFIQYGRSALGFDAAGAITQGISYPIIRNLYFLPGYEAAGAQLLAQGIAALAPQKERVYAFFHYFGMSCYGRHGKLFEGFPHIHRLLLESGFSVEHENVFYSSTLTAPAPTPVALRWYAPTCGRQRSCDFLLDGHTVGGGEVHFLSRRDTAYLRWIYVEEAMRGKGIGTGCMAALKNDLRHWGIVRLDTDTALTNLTAQRYYERNQFTREGLTRSYFVDAGA